jgi:protoporphyrinogen oxidase
MEEVVKGALGFSCESLGYNAKFIYPRKGGIGALSRRLAEVLPKPPVYQTQVTRVNVREHTASLSNGQMIRFDALVNTAALTRFVDMIEDAPAEIRDAARQLRASTVHYFDVGVRGTGAAASHYHWIYFPEPEFVFYRAGSYSAVHQDAAPPGCRSYYIEMSGGAKDLLSDIEALKKRVLADLKRAHILADDDEVLFMELCEIPFAYVIFYHHYEPSRHRIFDYLRSLHVQSCGRWGGWGYGGMEDALLDGKAAAETIDQQGA